MSAFLVYPSGVLFKYFTIGLCRAGPLKCLFGGNCPVKMFAGFDFRAEVRETYQNFSVFNLVIYRPIGLQKLFQHVGGSPTKGSSK